MSLPRFWRASCPLRAFILFASFSALLCAREVQGAIIDVGDVTPDAPGATGSVASPFRVGNTGFGTLTINNGTALTVTGAGNMFVGGSPTGIGIVDVTGFESKLIVNSNIIAGVQGTASLTFDDAARLDVSGDSIFGAEVGSVVDVRISDLGTVWNNGDDMAVGDRGRAVLEITAGGRLLSDTTDIGNTATGDGRVTVSGPLSLWRSTGALQIGDLGRGRLQIFDQAHVESNFAFVGANAGSVGRVEIDGEGSLWTPAGFLTVGYFCRGSMMVTGGGRVVSHDSRIGDEVGATGEVIVDGAGSVWNITGILRISEPSEASLTISDGGVVTAAGVVTVGALGRVTMSGGRLVANAENGFVNQGLVQGRGTIQTATFNNSTPGAEIRLKNSDRLEFTGAVTNSGSIDVQGGELETLGTTTNAGNLDARDGAVLRFGGNGLANDDDSHLAITSGFVNVFGAVDNNVGAQIVVGSEATAVFHGAVANDGQIFVQPGGNVLMLEDLNFGTGSTFGIQLTNVDPQDEASEPTDAFGQVHVGGGAALSGTLAVELANDFAPSAGDTFQILTVADGLSGTFSAESLPSLGGALTWDILYGADSVTLAVIGPALAGDYNGNGVVDAGDYTVWRDTLHQSVAPGSGADGDGNGMIDNGDYTVWKTNFGASGTAGAGGGSAVPEPTSLLLFVVASCWAVVRHGGRGANS